MTLCSDEAEASVRGCIRLTSAEAGWWRVHGTISGDANEEPATSSALPACRRGWSFSYRSFRKSRPWASFTSANSRPLQDTILRQPFLERCASVRQPQRRKRAVTSQRIASVQLPPAAAPIRSPTSPGRQRGALRRSTDQQLKKSQRSATTATLRVALAVHLSEALRR
jgi:hypothetical protein